MTEKIFSEDTDLWAAVLDHYGDHYAEGARDALENGEVLIWDSWDEIISQWCDLFEIPERAQFYIDNEAVQRDLEIEGSYTELSDGRVLEFFE
jgi:antirestriction protein